MTMMTRVKIEHAYETGVKLNANNVSFECDISVTPYELIYTIYNVVSPFIKGDWLNFYSLDKSDFISLEHIRSMSVFS